jgi:phosphoribosylglycinamide formyltransferase 1
MTPAKKRVAILISGRGSNMAALIEAARESDYPAEIVAVISDRPDAAGLKIAEANGVATLAIARNDFPNKFTYETAVEKALGEVQAEIVALAGYMRLLSPALAKRWSGRMVNIHPALLPSFRGLETHKAALDAGVLLHGCTVHFVTADVDSGPAIAQAAVPVLTNDDQHTLAARVLRAEHRLYPLALGLVCRGEARMKAGRTVFSRAGAERNADSMILSPDFAEDVPSIEDLARFTP